MERWEDDVAAGWSVFRYDDSVQWFASKKIGGDKKRVMGGRLNSLDRLIATVRNAETLDWNLYLQANPSRPAPGKAKLSREDIVRWRYVVVDLDPADDTFEVPRRFTEHPYYKLFSGRGFQFWIPLRTTLPITDRQTGENQADLYERCMRGYLAHLSQTALYWAPGWKVDPACSDLARVVRCPGSVNQATGKRAAFEDWDNSTYTPTLTLDELLPYAVPAVDVATTRLTAAECTNLMALVPHLNGRAKQFIFDGIPAPGRHTACYATCKHFHELGVPAARAFEWLLIGAGKSLDIVRKPLDISDVSRIVRQVYGKEAE